MSYKFSQIAGRLVKAYPSFTPPITNSALEESSKIVYSPSVKFAVVKSFVKPNKSGYGPMSKELLEKYRHFQVDNGMPIHLKGGQKDQIFYWTTLAMCSLGLVGSFHYIARAAYPQKG